MEEAPPSDQLAVLHLVTARLERAGIAHMISGSTAMNYYGQPRMTRDIDVVIELPEAGVDRFVDTFAGDFYCHPDAVRTAVAQRGLFNLIHLERLVKVDFIVRQDTPYRREEFARRHARNLVESVPDLDWSYLRHWAADLTVSAFLEEMQA